MTAQDGNQSSFFSGGRSDSAVSACILKKETEDAPGEHKRPRKVFEAGQGYTGMELSRSDGTHLHSHGHYSGGPSCGAATVRLAPSLLLRRGSSAESQLAALQGGAGRLCPLLGSGTPGWG